MMAASAGVRPTHSESDLPSRRAVFLAAAIFALTIAAYAPLLRCGFISFDDPTYVTDNFHVQAGLTWRGTEWAFSSFEGGNWHPLTWLSHMLDVQLFGMHAGGHHLTSVVLHALNASLLFWILLAGTKKLWRSAIVATVFAVHPLTVESVAWIAERKNVLSTLFWLLALGAYGWYAAKPSLRRYLLMVLFFCAGLMSKPMLVTLPLTLLAVDYWPLARFSRCSVRWLILEKAPLLVISLASSLVTIKAQQYEGAVNPAAFALTLRVEQALISYCAYLGKIFVPVRLSIIYMHLRSGAPFWEIAAAVVLLSGLTAAAVVNRIRAPYLVAGWSWFLITLIPVIGIVQVGSQGMADRYAYVPILGIIVAAVWLVGALAAPARRFAEWMPWVSVALIIALAFAALRQERYWRDDEVLFSHALTVDPHDNGAYDELGMIAGSHGNIEQGRKDFLAALAINPRDQIAHMGLGYCFNYSGDLANAAKEFQITLATTKSRRVESDMYSNLGAIAWKLGRQQEARQDYLQSVAALPRPRAYANLGFIELDAGNSASALDHFQSSIDLSPTSVAYYGLGQALRAEKRDAEALNAFQQALELDPGYGQAKSAIQEMRAAQQ